MTYSLGATPLADKRRWWKVSDPQIMRALIGAGMDDYPFRREADASGGPAFLRTQLLSMSGRHSVEVKWPGSGWQEQDVPAEKLAGATAVFAAMNALSLPTLSTNESNAQVNAAFAARQGQTSSSKLPLYIGFGLAGLAVVGIAYVMTRKPAPTPTLAKNRRLRRNSSFGPARDSAAARARAAFARGDGAAASRALAELRAIDIGLMPRAIKANVDSVRWDPIMRRAEERHASKVGRDFIRDMPAEDFQLLWEKVGSGMSVWDALRSMYLKRNSAYAIPERRAYPITSAKDAYHAAQRLKQGRVRNEADAKRIIAAIKHRHPAVWRDYLAGYPVSRIVASKRKGLAARSRA